MKPWLMNGVVECPYCLSENRLTVSWKYFEFKRTRCVNCKKVVWFKREHMKNAVVLYSGEKERFENGRENYDKQAI